MTLLSVQACSHKPIQSSGTLPTPYYQDIKPEPIAEHKVEALPVASGEQLRAWNEKAGKPTFGLIPAFYQLPEAMPAGAVRIEEGRIFGASYRSFTLQNTGPRPYAVLPASVGQTQVFSKVMNNMLDAGVRLVEVSMADANQIMQAEKKAIERGSVWFPGRQVPPGVDLMITIERGQGLYGPAYAGRVIRAKDGGLLALATQVDAGPLSLEPLLNQLVSDALRRLADEKQSR